jgi:phospho-N-acetylmuramoyl-pentapeptide-transferase
MANSITLYFGILIFSFIITSLAIIPFINLLYKIKFHRRVQTTVSPEGLKLKTYDKFSNWKAGTPVGGGALIITIVTLLFLLLFPTLQQLGIQVNTAHQINHEILIIFFTFISYGLLGLYDDMFKFFKTRKRQFFGLKFKTKFLLQWLLAFFIGYLLYRNLGINYLHIPSTTINLQLGWLYIPLAAFVIITFTNAFNITDGLDGLSSGILMITLFALWAISSTVLDTILSLFIALWIGSLIAFLYFNIYPARIWLGDIGALSFGATFAVVGLLLGKPLALFIIGGLFLVEGGSSLAQLLSRKLLKRRIIPAAPFHLTLQKMGWPEPKIVFRAWLATIMLGIFGAWLATL